MLQLQQGYSPDSKETVIVKLGILLLTATCVLAPFDRRPALAQSAREVRQAREAMVRKFVTGMGIKDKRVIGALRDTRRDQFVAPRFRRFAYYDQALPIGEGQTISSPFIVAFMTEQLDPKAEDKVLEIGTGSGYQAAVLSPLVKDVYSIEIVGSLGRTAQRTLRRLRYKNIHLKIGDGFKGWPEHAPFDKIIVTCSPENVPKPLVDQLAEGGRIVIPVGERYQQMIYLGVKKNGRIESQALRPTYFVPMTGAAEDRRKVKPDPSKPSIANGAFEEISEENKLPLAWYYQRQMKVIDSDDAPEGKRYAKFSNKDPGRPSHVMQGFGVDGRVVAELDVSLSVKAVGVRPGERRGEDAVLGVTFFDESRRALGESILGPWRGDLGWQKEAGRLKVPPKARHASVRVGLFGATGELLVDHVQIHDAKQKP